MDNHIQLDLAPLDASFLLRLTALFSSCAPRQLKRVALSAASFRDVSALAQPACCIASIEFTLARRSCDETTN